MGGLIDGGVDPADIVATVRRAERAAELAERHHGITAIAGEEEPDNNKQAATGSGVVILGVKPVGIADLAREISGSLSPGTIVISVAAAVSLEQLEAALPAGQPVIRTMPNTPAKLGRGVVSVSPGTSCSAGAAPARQGHPRRRRHGRGDPGRAGGRPLRDQRLGPGLRLLPGGGHGRGRGANWAWTRSCRCCWPARPSPGRASCWPSPARILPHCARRSRARTAPRNGPSPPLTSADCRPSSPTAPARRLSAPQKSPGSSPEPARADAGAAAREPQAPVAA